MAARIFAIAVRRINFRGCAQHSFTKLPPKPANLAVLLQSSIHSSSFRYQEQKSIQMPNSEKNEEDIGNYDNISDDPKDRSRAIPLETSMSYLESDAYRRTYGDHKVSV